MTEVAKTKQFFESIFVSCFGALIERYHSLVEFIGSVSGSRHSIDSLYANNGVGGCDTCNTDGLRYDDRDVEGRVGVERVFGLRQRQRSHYGVQEISNGGVLPDSDSELGLA